MMLIEATVEEEIRAAASMASLALAILVFFTNVRREALTKYLAEVDPFDVKTLVAAGPDILLALLTGAAVVAMAPLCFDTFDFGEVGRRTGAVPSMFGLIWLGFTLVLLFQLSMLWRRFREAIKAR